MNTDASMTRREALLGTLKGALAASLAVPFITTAAETAPPPDPEFVPENDYPFFGYEPDAPA